MKDLRNKIKAVLLALLTVSLAYCGSDNFLVKVVVRGLSGTLVLQNNGTDDLTINSDGAAKFSVRLAKETAYSVTVFSQPYAQTCELGENSSGTVIGENIEIEINCRGKIWFHPADLYDYVSPIVDRGVWGMPHAAMDSFGNAIIAYSQDISRTTQDWQVFISEYRNRVWTHPASGGDHISPQDPGNGNGNTDPVRAAMDDNGNAIVVWSQEDSTDIKHIFMSEYRSGSWSHPEDIASYINPNAPLNTWSELPYVAMSNNGTAIVVWMQENESGNDQIFVSDYGITEAGQWTHPANINTNISPDTEDASHPMAAMDSAGNAIIVWKQSDGTQYHIYKSEYRNGTWTHPSGLGDHIDPATPSETDSEDPYVAMDDNGNAIIVWAQSDGTHSHIYKSEYRSGEWTHPTSLTQYINPDTDSTQASNETDAYRPKAAMENDGNALIVWEQDDSFGYRQIFLSEYRAGDWTHPQHIDENISPDFTHAYDQNVAMDNNSNAIVTWSQVTFNGNYFRFKSEYRGGQWKHPEDIYDMYSSFWTNRDQYEGSLSMSDNGEAVITWYGYNQDRQGYSVFMSHYR